MITSCHCCPLSLERHDTVIYTHLRLLVVRSLEVITSVMDFTRPHYFVAAILSTEYKVGAGPLWIQAGTERLSLCETPDDECRLRQKVPSTRPAFLVFQPVRQSACLPANLPASLLTCLPAFLSVFMHAGYIGMPVRMPICTNVFLLVC